MPILYLAFSLEYTSMPTKITARPSYSNPTHRKPLPASPCFPPANSGNRGVVTYRFLLAPRDRKTAERASCYPEPRARCCRTARGPAYNSSVTLGFQTNERELPRARVVRVASRCAAGLGSTQRAPDQHRRLPIMPHPASNSAAALHLVLVWAALTVSAPGHL